MIKTKEDLMRGGGWNLKSGLSESKGGKGKVIFSDETRTKAS